jgi:5-formyltetrahydrofolate cyclo-ligase
MTPGWSLIDEKRALRRAMRDRRERLDADARGRAARGLGDMLARLPEVAGARTVSAYVPVRGEIDTSAIVADRVAHGTRVVYPRVTAERPRLRFHAVTPDTTLVPGVFGILEPPASSPEVAIEDIDVVLVPGLAFDVCGRRLGYGGGYYDEAAARLRAAGAAGRPGLLVGVGYDFQLIDVCPAGDGDVTIDWVVTDLRVIRCAQK